MPKKEPVNVAKLQEEIEELRYQLAEASETIEAIRTGQIDALVVESEKGQELYTLTTADHAYRIIIEQMGQGALTLNERGLIHYCNSCFANIVKKSVSEITGRNFEDFLEEHYKPRFRDLFSLCWGRQYTEEASLLSDHSVVPVQLSMTSLDLKEVKALSIIVTDLSSQKNYQSLLEENNRKLEESNRALELSNHDLQQFASVASHDLQEPLRKIQIFSGLLGNNELTHDSNHYLEKIIGSATRMKALILDVLNYSKLSANNADFQKVDLNELIRELLGDFELIIQEKNAVIQTALLPTITANRGQMRQLLQNLLSNALKFTKPGKAPRIHLKAALLREKSFDAEEVEGGAYCLISVKDEGIGFDDKYRTQIFSLFERLHSKDSFEGTGIGLAIAKKIVDKHNGLISAHSHDGDGAEFLILLPVSQP
jgi:PAS domain S-box-containing protein